MRGRLSQSQIADEYSRPRNGQTLNPQCLAVTARRLAAPNGRAKTCMTLSAKPLRYQKLILLAVTVLAPTLPAQTPPQDQAIHEAYEQRIHHLEDRVASLEQSLARLLAASSPPAEAVATPAESRSQAAPPAVPSRYEPPLSSSWRDRKDRRPGRPPPCQLPSILFSSITGPSWEATSICPWWTGPHGSTVSCPTKSRWASLNPRLRFKPHPTWRKWRIWWFSNTSQPATGGLPESDRRGYGNWAGAISRDELNHHAACDCSRSCPSALKYTNTSLDRWRLRPYGVIGFAHLRDDSQHRTQPEAFRLPTTASVRMPRCRPTSSPW